VLKVNTKYWDLRYEQIDANHPYIQEAANALLHKQVVAFPTETVYGLGAVATDEESVDKIFQAKGRPADNPLIVHIGDIEQVHELVSHIPAKANMLMKTFWPGPLTIILPSNEASAKNVTAGLSTVGIRLPDHPIAQALIKACGKPLAAPSANRSGKPSPTTAQHVLDDLQGKIYGVVDGGPTGVGVESTVVDCTEEIPVILRPGGITKEEMEKVIGTVKMDQALQDEREKPRAPGMKYTHYAPNAPLWLVEGTIDDILSEVQTQVNTGKKVGVLTTNEHIHYFSHVLAKSVGSGSDLQEVAKHIYDVLRSFDKEKVDIIIGVTFSREGVGTAIMNRLEKAASRIMKK
jgi:L-threonylcarbamoyladenylate synthase